MKFSVVVCSLIVCVAFAGRVCAQTYTPGELAATAEVAKAQARADELRRRIDAPTRTPVPTVAPTETPTPTETPLPTETSTPVSVATATLQPTASATTVAEPQTIQRPELPPTQPDPLAAKLERSVPFLVFIALVVIGSIVASKLARRYGL